MLRAFPALFRKMSPRVVSPIGAAMLTIALTGGTIGAAAPKPGATAHGAGPVLKLLPVKQLPALVDRGKSAESGTLVMTVPGLFGPIQSTTTIVSSSSGQIGKAVKHGHTILFTFSNLPYDIGPLSLPFGLKVDPQRLTLDPSGTTTMSWDMRTGKLTNDSHLVLTATNTLYDGSHSLALPATGSSSVISAKYLGHSRYSIRVQSHITSQVAVSTVTVSGHNLPVGKITNDVQLAGTYILDFSKHH